MNARRKLPISLFLQNFYVLDNKMKERMAAAQAGIDEVLMHHVGQDQLDKLNTLLAVQGGIRTVYDLVEELKEELNEGREPETETGTLQ